MEKIYKVTSATVGTTKKGYNIFKLQLNNSILATRLFPLKEYERKYDKLYLLYLENKSLDFLEGKLISVSVSHSQYGYQFSRISSFDVLKDFKQEVDSSKGEAFSTKLPIFDFLSSMHRSIEPDGSIKIHSDFGDMRVSKINGVDICHPFDTSIEKLNLKNINYIFNKFYKDVDLPACSESEGGSKSYYKISMEDAAIVRMDNHVKVSYKMTTSGDYDRWNTYPVLKIGDRLPDDYIQFLKSK